MPWQNNGGRPGGGDRNPWGGGPAGGGPQPPNIDDLIRKGQQQLRNLLPGGAKGPIGLVLLLFLLALVFVASSYTVQPSEQGVVMRFGKWVRSEPPGFHLKLPYPIETVIRPSVTTVNRIDIGFRTDTSTPSSRGRRGGQFFEESLMLTGDENIVDVAFTVFWRIDDAGKFLFNIQNPQVITIKVVAESVMREIVGRTAIQSVLTEGRAAIEGEARELLQSVLTGYEAGVLITEVKLERVDPPAQVIEAFRDVQKAEADRERFRNEAEAYANTIIPEARGNANRMTQEAEAYKEQVTKRAEGEAARFMSVYTEYALAKDVTRKRMYLETMESILGGMNKVIIDSKNSTGVVPYLPLPEIDARRRNEQERGQ
jgi:membrane protease subunit HflK